MSTSDFTTNKNINDIPLSVRQRLDKEIDSDDFLREFFSISEKIERVPTPKEIKDEYYSR